MPTRDEANPPQEGWLAVSLPEQPDVALALVKLPRRPAFDDEVAAKLSDLVAKGAARGLFRALTAGGDL
jgi:hypothetical protein